MKQLFTLFCFLLVCSCGQVPLVSTNADNNTTYKVDYLFEHEGCKVYRFFDRGGYIYFTNCTGNVTMASNDSTKTEIQNIIVSVPENGEK